MRRYRFMLLPALLGCVLLFPAQGSDGKPVPVRIVQKGSRYELVRGGQPYFIRGAGGWEMLEELQRSGSNSIRTWGAPKDGELLDKAQTLGFSVAFGLWLGQIQHKFDYADPKQVQDQFEKLKAIVLKNKDHPALLIWGVGNEIELGTPEHEDDPNIWKAVEQVAAMIKREDPNHPAMTVVAGISERKIGAIKKHCPSLDALGVNSYAELPTLPRRLAEFGWEKPYIVTEFGPAGSWQALTAPWGAPIEESSTHKANTYLTYYLNSIESERGRCLGSYVYFWGIQPRVVTTHTWYETFLPGGNERLGAVDALMLAWTGKLPANCAPEILAWHTDAAVREVEPGSRHTAVILARDIDGDPLRVRWEVREESPALSGPPPPVVPNTILEDESSQVPGPTQDFLKRRIEFFTTTARTAYTAPQKEGAFRLFVYVYDGKGNAATANIPFYVKSALR